MAVNVITQFVLKQFAKRSAKKTGIASLKQASDSIVKSNVRNIEIILKNMGIDPKTLKSTDEVFKHMTAHQNLMDHFLKQEAKGLGLGKGLKSLEKKAPFQGFTPRVQQDVDSIVKNLKSMEPVAAMKEANKVIKREGRYKNLTNDESQKILKETDDHIFQRDIQYDEFGDPIKPEPEDFQSGGLAYMLGEPNTRIEALQHAGVIADPRGLYTDPSIYSKGESEIPQNYYEGGGVGRGPWTKGQAPGITEPPPQPETPVHHAQGLSDPLKAPRGLPSLAPRNMDPQYIQQQKMQKMMAGMGQQRPMAAEGGIMRAAFKEGGKMSRRGFMKLIAGLATLPVVGKYFKAAKLAKPAAAVTETIIKSNAPGMPAWFPHFVKRVLKEGKDETEKLATLERQTVHTTKLPESGTPVQVTRDLVTDDIIVDIGEQTKHGWPAGRHGQPVQLVLKKGEWIEPSTKGGGYMTTKGKNVYPGMSKGALKTEKTTGKGLKTKDEFYVDEAEFTGGHPENVKFEESVIEKYGDHGSDFTEVEKYAMKSDVSTLESHGPISKKLKKEGWIKDKKVIGKKAQSDAWAEGRAESAAEEFDEFASGGLAYLLGE